MQKTAENILPKAYVAKDHRLSNGEDPVDVGN